jgi:Methyltransferase domain
MSGPTYVELPASAQCRWCASPVEYVFSLIVLSEHSVGYFKCVACESLQTEKPYWLDKAYAKNLAALDTGVAQRNLANLAVSYSIARLFGLRNLLDFGGGDGLLCRLLRDYGFNCFVKDKFASPTYAMAFCEPDFKRPDMQLAFEVFEHFEAPRAELPAFFSERPQVVLISTNCYTGQGSDWWYLTPETGQHVFFYSPRAIAQIGAAYGYKAIRGGAYTVFVRLDVATALRCLVAKGLLVRGFIRLLSAGMRLLPTPGVWQDFERIRSKPR